MILVFGQTGQVARELARAAPEARYLGRAEADLLDPGACAAAITARRPEAVINAAAWTAVDRAETEVDTASVINGASPAAMAQACAALGIPLVQISTDYVFDGAGEDPFAPDHLTAPINAYGRSKLKGEEGVGRAGGVHAILRTSCVFSRHGTNFVRTMLRLGAERESLRVVADQIGGPTPARAIAEACLRMAQGLRDRADLSGIYHLSGAPAVSWADFARAIMSEAGLACRIEDIPSTAYPTPAPRPLNSRLDCVGLAKFGLTQPDWRADLKDVIAELKDVS